MYNMTLSKVLNNLLYDLRTLVDLSVWLEFSTIRDRPGAHHLGYSYRITCIRFYRISKKEDI